MTIKTWQERICTNAGMVNIREHMEKEIDELRAELDRVTTLAHGQHVELYNARLALAALKQQEPVAAVCDCEGTTDDEGLPLHYALLQLHNALSPGTMVYLAAGAQPAPEPAHIQMAPGCLNTNDKAFWVIGWNECRAAMLKAQKGQP
jgi:hypothetical protein